MLLCLCAGNPFKTLMMVRATRCEHHLSAVCASRFECRTSCIRNCACAFKSSLLQTATPAAQAILKQTEREDALLLTRNLELGDLMFGYEQARQLLLKDAHGRSLLALAEQPGNFVAGVLLRQVFDSSRAFTIDVFDVPHLLEQGGPPERRAHPSAVRVLKRCGECVICVCMFSLRIQTVLPCATFACT